MMASGDQEPSHSLDVVSTCSLGPVHLGNLLVEDTQIFICLCISLVVLDGCVNPNSFECGFLPASNNVPSKSPSGHVIQGTEALCEKKRRLK